MKFLKKNSYNILIIIIFLILPFIFFKDTFNPNSVLLGSGDANAIALPLHELKVNLIKNMQIPFWNNYNLSGFPLLAYTEANVFYPISTILELIFPIVFAYNISILLHYSLAGIFMFFFLKEYDLEILACFTGGLIFMFSGTMIVQRSHPWQIFTLVWIPLILLMVEKYRKTKKYKFILFASIFYAFCFFAGNPQTFFYGSLVILFFIIYYSFVYSRDYKLLLAMTLFAIGFLIALIQIIPTYELMKLSVRDKISYDFFSAYSFNFKMIPVLFFPFIYGNPFNLIEGVTNYFGPWNYTEMIIYFGISTLVFAFFGILSKNKHKFLWIFILILSAFLVFGDSTPLYKLFYYIPLYNKFRVPARNWFEFSVAFSIISAFGFDYFIKLQKDRIKRINTTFISIFSFMLVGFLTTYYLYKKGNLSFLSRILASEKEKAELFIQNFNILNYPVLIPLIIIFLTIVILILSIFYKNKALHIIFIIFIFLDLMSFGRYYEGNSNLHHLNKNLKESQSISFLSDSEYKFRIFPVIPEIDGYVFWNNKNIHLKASSVSGYVPFLLKDYNAVTKINDSSDLNTGVKDILKNKYLVSMLNIKYLIINQNEIAEELIKNYNYTIKYKNNDKLILENNDYLEKFYFAGQVKKIGSVKEFNEILWNTGNELSNSLSDKSPKKVIYAENYNNSHLNFDNKNYNIKIKEYKNNKVILETENKSEGFLVFSDTFYPGWRAYVDGKETEIFRINGILKGVYVKKGNNLVEFIFKPSLYYFLIFTSGITFLVSIIFIFILKNKNMYFISIFIRNYHGNRKK